MDVLSRQLEFQSSQGYISGIRLTRGAPRLTSIMFADDLIILGEASEIQAVRTQLVLQQFCRMSGQRVGDDKSCLWFSRATDLQMQQCVMSIFNATLGDNSHVYLGVPVQASRPAHFGLLVTKIQKKLNAWTAKSLSQAGKVVLIRSVIEPMVVYNTAGGPLPTTVASKIDTLIRSFFWESGGKHKMHLVSWKQICTHKSQGGLGIRPVSVLNGAMILKNLWKLACKEFEQHPWVQILYAKYLTNRKLWLSGVPNSCTKFWRALMQYRDLLKPHVRWHIGQGDKCRAFGEPWHDARQVLIPVNARQRRLTLIELTEGQGSTWSHDKLAEQFGVAASIQIISNHPHPPLANNSRGDRLLFTKLDSGKFNFKEACNLLHGISIPIPSNVAAIFKTIWHCPGLLPRVRLFLWKLMHGALPLRGTCMARIGNHVTQCPVCDLGPDLPMHALFHCPFAETFWFASSFSIRSQQLPSNPTDLLIHISQSLQGMDFTSFVNHLWALWKCRCSHVYDGARLSHTTVTSMALTYNKWSRLTSSLTIPRPLKHIWSAAQQLVESGVTCFVDGSFKDPNCAGWGFLFYERDCLLRYGLRYGRARSATGSEISAMLLAVKTAIDMGLQNCTFFTDCSLLQQILDCRVAPDSLPWQEFNAMLELMDNFRSWSGFSCTFIPRENNIEAHHLANYARVHEISCTEFTFPLFHS
ncbi:RNA-directed DNA polymerase (reverse transcriptase)-related family protein [Rhynchospora pubera]|uniref:RNA-directed DNA polymerase (Reverse transcriptase)-related family protein n=1 Tax=Rhynchospora pubera TaxID=906938 RepID=A0AAV8F3K9_9POAL|nr:RNA-directed DNA polymerase (reverse transcriptase)-related family protein [Rhynchospora pubera]